VRSSALNEALRDAERTRMCDSVRSGPKVFRSTTAGAEPGVTGGPHVPPGVSRGKRVLAAVHRHDVSPPRSARGEGSCVGDVLAAALGGRRERDVNRVRVLISVNPSGRSSRRLPTRALAAAEVFSLQYVQAVAVTTLAVVNHSARRPCALDRDRGCIVDGGSAGAWCAGLPGTVVRGGRALRPFRVALLEPPSDRTQSRLCPMGPRLLAHVEVAVRPRVGGRRIVDRHRRLDVRRRVLVHGRHLESRRQSVREIDVGHRESSRRGADQTCVGDHRSRTHVAGVAANRPRLRVTTAVRSSR